MEENNHLKCIHQLITSFSLSIAIPHFLNIKLKLSVCLDISQLSEKIGAGTAANLANMLLPV